VSNEYEDADAKLSYYMEIGVVNLEGMDDQGEIMFSINENAKDLAPELWERHINYVESSLMELYEAGLLEIEYDENLEATVRISEEGKRIAREKGIAELDHKDIPNN
jgi:hypothetical protein